MSGVSDEDLAQKCRDEGRILVTLDLDFADIKTYPPAEFPGRIVLRLTQQDKAHVLAVIERLVELLDKEPLKERLWIVDENRMRIRS